jgi:SlyX protein
MPDDTDRIEKLETKLAFQEDALAALNDALVDQQVRLDHLEAMLKLLVEQLREQVDGQPPEAAEDPPPPHY